MVRTINMVLLAALLVMLLLTAAVPVGASDGPWGFAAQVEEDQASSNRYAGQHGDSPLDDVPVVPMIAGTAGVLGVLSIIAFRREWI